MIVAAFALAAILTPPDVISQLMLGIPLILLYEVSLAIMWFGDRKKIKENLIYRILSGLTDGFNIPAEPFTVAQALSRSMDATAAAAMIFCMFVHLKN